MRQIDQSNLRFTGVLQIVITEGIDHQIGDPAWGGGESSGETNYDSHFSQIGTPIAVSYGDSGYGVEYPAASQYVTAVGGTTLNLNSDSTIQ